MSDIELTVLKVVYKGLLVRLQRHKSFPIHYVLRGTQFKSVFKHSYIALNIIKLTYVIQMHKSMFRTQDDTKGF